MFIMIGSNVINLAKVSNVAFKDEFAAKERGRIIFNFCYSIQIKNEIGESIFIPDYKYSDNIDPDVFYSEVESLKSQLKKAGFIEPSSDYHYWVNKNHISYITKDVYRKKIIFNLSTPISKTLDDKQAVINDFVFWSFDDSSFMNEVYEYVLTNLN